MNVWGLPMPPDWRPTKAMRILQLGAVLLLTACLPVHAQNSGQRITLSAKMITLEKVFRSIYQQTGYQFVYNDETMKGARKINIDVKDATLQEVLVICFKDQPLDYIIQNKTVVIRPKTTITLRPVDNTSFVEVSGRVLNDKGQPLSGATVVVKETGRGTSTNARGEFVVSAVPLGNTLVFSFIGYARQQVKIQGPGELNIFLAVAGNELDKVVVQGYGNTTQRLSTGDIGTVTSEEIEKQPVMNPLMALQGRVAGLVVTPTSGYASGPVKAEIRGRNTINPNFTSDPLYIIDGVPLTVLEVSGQSNYANGSVGMTQAFLSAYSPAKGQSPLFSLNPADIESIAVLKDADATAIYGSRGANGVILITTKRGKAGKSKLDVTVSQGESAVTRHWSMLNTTQYLQLRREAFRNDALTPTVTSAPDLMSFDTTRNINWQDQLWGGRGQVTDVQAGLSGGEDRTIFRIGANYHRQTEILTKSGANQKAGVSFNLVHSTVDRKFRISFTTNYSYAYVNTVGTPSAVTLPPDAPAIYDSLGNLNYAPWNAIGPYGGNQYPFSSLKQPYTSKTNFITSNVNLSYEVVKGLKLTASIGYNNSQNNTSLLQFIASFNPLYNPTGSAIFSSTSNSNWIIEPQLDYQKWIGRGQLQVMAGVSEESTVTDANTEYGLGYTNDDLMRSIVSAATVLPYENYAEDKYVAAYGRVNYNWAGKYILNGNVRRDGSSRFGPGDQFGNFGDVGVAWIASEERWLKRLLPTAFSLVKFRGSYGITGSDQVGDYQYLSQWESTYPSGGAALSYGGISPLVPQHAVNQDYHWQSTKKLEAALELGFLKDRITLNVVYYRDRCDNQLTQYPTAVFTGFGSVEANWPASTQNSGLELTATGRIINTSKFSWTAAFNMAADRNILLSYPNLSQSPYAALYKVGQSVNTVYLLHYTGVDPLTGQYSFEDFHHNGNVLINYSAAPGTQGDDRCVSIDLTPKFTGGMSNEFTYKNCTLSFFLYFKKQMAQNALYSTIGNGIGSMSNQPTAILNHIWQKPGDNALYAKVSTESTEGDGFFGISDRAYTDASFIRLQNVAFSYGLPAGIVKKAGMEGCRLFINAQNLFVITRYKGIDPEIQNFGGMPPVKVITGGISLNF